MHDRVTVTVSVATSHTIPNAIAHAFPFTVSNAVSVAVADTISFPDTISVANAVPISNPDADSIPVALTVPNTLTITDAIAYAFADTITHTFPDAIAHTLTVADAHTFANTHAVADAVSHTLATPVPTASPGSVTLSAVDDSYVAGDLPNHNFGSAAELDSDLSPIRESVPEVRPPASEQPDDLRCHLADVRHERLAAHPEHQASGQHHLDGRNHKQRDTSRTRRRDRHDLPPAQRQCVE